MEYTIPKDKHDAGDFDITYTIEPRTDYHTKMQHVTVYANGKSLDYLAVSEAKEVNIILVAKAMQLKKVSAK